MFLKDTLSYTNKRIEYDNMLRDCGHLHGRELEIKQFEMEQVAIEIQKIRERLSQIAPEKLYFFTKYG